MALENKKVERIHVYTDHSIRRPNIDINSRSGHIMNLRFQWYDPEAENTDKF